MRFTIQIKRRKQNEVLVLIVLAITLCFGFFLDLLQMPGVIKYTVDIFWLLLLATIVLARFRMPNNEAAQLLKLVIVFWLVTLIGWMLNAVNPLYYLWGFRNNFRFPVYFFSCAMFLREDTGSELLQLFDKLFYLNFAVTLIQFFILGKRMDYLGGIFGDEVGCNGKTLVFFSIILTKSILGYMEGTESTKTCLVKCGIALAIAAMAELKFFFFVFAFIVIMSALITKTTRKKFVVIAASGIGIYFSIILLINIFPQWAGFFSFEKMLESATSSKGYTGRGDMNRLTTIPITWKRFLTDWPKRLFGLGLGNCDTSAFSFLNTPFYQRYGYLRYNWFSSSFLFLETGVAGMVTYLSFFVALFFYTRRRERTGEGRKEWCQMAQILAPVCFMLFVFNGSLRMEEAYWLYFVLALPFINMPVCSGKGGEVGAQIAC